MGTTMRIPTEFTAVDKFTSVVSKMTAGVSNFTKATSSAVSSVNTRINSVFKSLGTLSQLALGIGIAGIFSAGIQSIQDYENAVASFRTIVSDLSDKDFAKYRNEINNVAKDTKKSSIDVALSFEKIAGLNSDLAKTAGGLGLVSKAAIVLSKASGDELGTSAENLVGIMNQFSLGAKEADKVINVLAAGQAVGASSITQSAEAYKNFGAVAKGANITLEESQALIQTLGKFSLFGAEAGTKLRGTTLQLQKAGLGYASGQFNINDALNEANKISKSLTTQRAKDTFVLKTFGAENITAGKILMNNIKVYEDYTKGVTGTTEAQKAAAINSNTLTNKISELKNAWTNMLTSSEKSTDGLNLAKEAVGFLTDNLSEIITVVTGFALVYGGLQAIMLLTSTYTFLSSVAMGVLGATTGAGTIAIGSNSVAMGAYNIVSGIMTAMTWLANSAFVTLAISILAATLPILAIIAAVLGIVYIFMYWDEICAWFSKQWSNFTNFLGETWDSLTAWFKNFSFVDFFKNIGKAIVDFMLLPLRGVLKIASFLPGKVGDLAQKGLDKINEMTGNMGVSLVGENSVKKLESPAVTKENNAQKNLVNGQVNVNVSAKKGTEAKTTSYFSGGIPVMVTPTQGAFGK